MIPYIRIDIALVDPRSSNLQDPPITIADVYRFRTTASLELNDQEENAARLADQVVRQLFAKLRDKMKEVTNKE